MKTPNDLFAEHNALGRDAKEKTISLMKAHGVKSINTKVYMYDYGFDFVDVSVYDRKLDCHFYEPVSMLKLDKNDILHIYYDGEDSGEVYFPRVMDWLNIFALVYNIFEAVDNKEVELFTDTDSEEE